MSENEQDAAMGRTVKDLAENKRKAAAMEETLGRYAKAFKDIATALNHNVSADFNLKVLDSAIRTHSVLEGLDLSALVAFVTEYAQVRQSVDDGTARLRSFGV